MGKILWMDNDHTFLWPHVTRLKDAGHDVMRAYTVSEAEKWLDAGEVWDLVIIDPMMNISEEEEKDYPPAETDGGLKAGAVFYKRTRDQMEEMGADAVVFTMRHDEEIVEDFLRLGLCREKIMYKMDLSDTADFLSWIEKVIRKGEET